MSLQQRIIGARIAQRTRRRRSPTAEEEASHQLICASLRLTQTRLSKSRRIGAIRVWVMRATRHTAAADAAVDARQQVAVQIASYEAHCSNVCKQLLRDERFRWRR